MFVFEHKRLKIWGEAIIIFFREKLSFDGKCKLLKSEAQLKFNYGLGLKQINNKRETHWKIVKF